MTSPTPAAPATVSSVLATVDAGHIGSGLNNAGGLASADAHCKLDLHPWPCPAIVEARQLDTIRRNAARS